MSEALSRRMLVTIVISMVAIIAIVAWIAASGRGSEARMQKPVKAHAEGMEAAAEAAENAGSGRGMNVDKEQP
ncbi:MAG: hypothetical protein H0W83_16515 [Planctomycetes bacterium]|nr:hypothetical protein [Planctomycetota bacterium]